MAKKTKLTEGKVWRERYNLAANRQERQFQKFASWFDLHYAHINTSDFALWRSKVFLPIVPAKARALIAKLTALNPGWEISLYGDALSDENSQGRAEKAQWKLEHDWDNPVFDEPMPDKLFSPLVDAVVTGTGIAKVPWCFDNVTRYEKDQTDEFGEIDLTKESKIVDSQGYNDLIPHDIMATFIAPGAKNLQSAGWVILEDWVTYSQLEQENEASGFTLYDNLDKVKEMKSSVDRFSTQKQARDQVNDGTDALEADTTVDQIKRLECYEKSTGYIYVFAVGDNGDGDESFIQLRAKKNIYWHGQYPLVAFYVEKRPHNFWGKGIYEDTERLQSAFSDLFNFLIDGINLSQAPMILKQEGEDYNYIIEPGGEFLYKNTKPEGFKFPEPNPAQFTTVMSQIEKMVEDTTISSYATGSPNSATDKTAGTASGIMRLQEAAGDKVSAMKAQFANSLRSIGRMWLSNNQQFLDAPLMLMGQKDNMPAPVEINPADLQGQMVLRINDSSMEPTTKEQRIAQLNDSIQQLEALRQASVEQAMMTQYQTKPLILDYASLAQDVLQARGQANFDKVIVNPDEQGIQFAPPQQEQQPQQPDPAAQAQVDIQKAETPDYKSASPYVQYQMEARAGFDPDPAHLHETAGTMLNDGENEDAELGQKKPAAVGADSRPSQTL